MTTPYRNETDALRERKAALAAESARLKEQRAQLEWLAGREQEIQRELSAIDEKLLGSEAKRRLPTLDQISVASPCNASWDDMLGDARVRFCTSCEKNVYNLSAMPKEEAEALIGERLAGANEVCVRYYQRADGTVMTADCPVGVTKKRRKKRMLAIAGAGALAFGAYSALKSTGACRPHPMMGAVAYDPQQQLPPPIPELASPPPVQTETPAANPPPAERPHVQGRMTVHPTK